MQVPPVVVLKILILSHFPLHRGSAPHSCPALSLPRDSAQLTSLFLLKMTVVAIMAGKEEHLHHKTHF